MKALLSIKPEFVEQIFKGVKKFEYRKALFKNKVSHVVVYSTMPVGKIVGEFEIEDIIQDKPSKLWSQTQQHSGISHNFFKDYFKGRSRAFAIKIKNPTRYKTPIDPYKAYDNFTAPQSFLYFERFLK